MVKNTFQLVLTSGGVVELQESYTLTEMTELYLHSTLKYQIETSNMPEFADVVLVRQVAPYPVGECGMGRRVRNVH